MEHATPDKPEPAQPTPVNWYSGWRLLATAAATVLSAKLIGILGTAVALLLFIWLQPKRGTGLACAVAVAVAYSDYVLPQFVDQRAAPSEQIDWEKGVIMPPPSSH
jgi:hypothetical protein